MTIETDLININLPYFGGFYQGYEQEIDSIIESEVEYFETELLLKNITSDNFEIKDFDAFENNTAEVFADNIKEFLKENDFQFDYTNIEVDSPREYNFRSDYITCKLPCSQFEAIKNFVDDNLKNEFIRYCGNNFSSRDGFVSFISNDAYDFINNSIGDIIAEYPDNYQHIFEGYLAVLLKHFENNISENLYMNTCEGIREFIYENLVCDRQADALFG